VDWQKIFNTFHETMRLKLKCRGANKIPSERLFCLDKKLYKISITLEGLKLPEGGSKLGGDGDEEEIVMTRGNLIVWMI
jgi:hypothetical protein